MQMPTVEDIIALQPLILIGIGEVGPLRECIGLSNITVTFSSKLRDSIFIISGVRSGFLELPKNQPKSAPNGL